MKYLVIILFLSFSAFGQRRGQIIREIKKYKLEISKNPIYSQPVEEVSNACYAIVSSDFENIVFEESTNKQETVKYNSEFANVFSEISDVTLKLSKELKKLTDTTTTTTKLPPRRFFKAINETDKERKILIIKILGDTPYIKIGLIYKYEIRTLITVNGQSKYTDWSDMTIFEDMQNNYKLKIYELLNGKIELSQEMIDRIENFNKNEPKEKNKILKVIDY